MMADGTHIEWTEATWNPITGCSVVSPGCTNCYAMKLAGTRLAHHPSRAGLTQDSKAGPVWTGEVRFNEEWLDQPLRWTKPRMIFVCAHGDLFHESVPDAWIDRIFAVMALCPQHTFQVLTKRSARMREYFSRSNLPHGRIENVWLATSEFATTPALKQMICNDLTWGKMHDRWPLPNVWLGVSVEDQQRADERIPDLLATPAAVRWISAEPLLGPVDLVSPFYAHSTGYQMQGYLRDEAEHDDFRYWAEKLDWVVVGGESGPGARPMHPDWARSLRDQCVAAGVPFFFKQWGQWAPIGWEHASSKHLVTADGFVVPKALADMKRNRYGHGLIEVAKVGKKRAGRLLDGALHDEMPEVPHA